MLDTQFVSENWEIDIHSFMILSTFYSGFQFGILSPPSLSKISRYHDQPKSVVILDKLKNVFGCTRS